ncbi:amino acid ABC transporter permease [Mesorhizobium tianshanense]|uniref:Putative glutamine transport system permease protein GlnP n=1 Tax=Mesorhizobium tianshanense TaxID=39844 RepID=A0A562N8B5_9HYPH|nr:amino acid ABC transporter permease [Mesorhizobium tianshanense]TWI28409.1 amino acid ABC transporter membrane protein (PAAT family) [Mesorhizobium tianshanense]GLS36882.1 amino acid ABC transporter permease [Mesorhizobium tianshanense]
MTKFIAQATEYLPLLLHGVWLTVVITFVALCLATALGLVWALFRTSGIRSLAVPTRLFIDFVRGVPLLVILFYIYFVAPDIGINLTALQAGMIGLGLAHSCYLGETFRAGIDAVDRGQVEAAKSIGMKRPLMMRRVVLPQALKIILPPYANNMVMLLKDSSLVSVISVQELTMQGKMLASSTFDNMTVFTLVALLYLCLTVPLNILMRRVEIYLGAGR